MPLQSSVGSAAAPTVRSLWAMLAALCMAFMLSQAYRTAAAMMASRLQAEFSLSPQQLGSYAGAFHFAFGAMQLFMGLGIDLHGVRRTMLTTFPVAIVGALLSAFAHGYAMLVLGQVLIGVGCAAAFLVCTVFITRHFPQERFASVSGLVLGIGGGGMLLTATPLAWVVQEASWRAGFIMLAGLSALAWLVIFIRVREPAQGQDRRHESLATALRGLGALLLLPHTLGIMALGAVTYAAFMALRGLWLGPLLIGRYGYTLVQSGNVALLVSVVSLFGPPLFGRFGPQGAGRRRCIIVFTLALVSLFAIMAMVSNSAVVVGCSVLVGFLSGFVVLQYADVRASYPRCGPGAMAQRCGGLRRAGLACRSLLGGAGADRRHADSGGAGLCAAAGAARWPGCRSINNCIV
jgi:predicted MFS family arabinose efflux permease